MYDLVQEDGNPSTNYADAAATLAQYKDTSVDSLPAINSSPTQHQDKQHINANDYLLEESKTGTYKKFHQNSLDSSHQYIKSPSRCTAEQQRIYVGTDNQIHVEPYDQARGEHDLMVYASKEPFLIHNAQGTLQVVPIDTWNIPLNSHP